MNTELPNNAAGRLLARMVSFMGRRYVPRKPSFHPTINRHTGQPHEHKRESARRIRQMTR